MGKYLFGFLLIWLVSVDTQAQRTVVKGRVTDANSGDPIPFANIIFKGTSTGTTSDFEGFYQMDIGLKTDSVIASYIGYLPRSKAVKLGIDQTINFQLKENVMSLQEVVFMAGENPAFEILRGIIANKKKNDKKSLEAYQYETYTKIEIDVDNISEKFRKRKVMRKITSVLDSVERIAGEDGKPILPVFISETLSQFYYRKDPKLQHEKILKTSISGVGIEDGTLVSQFIGSSFQEYNFYQNWLNIVSKEFVSPIADGWKLYYDYELADSAYVGEDFCYRLDYYPKREQDLAFKGTMWITKKDYALKQIDALVPSSVNLNFIEKIRIQQELAPSSAGPWLPIKNRVLIDVGEISDRTAGMLAKFYTSNKNVKVNDRKSLEFYARPIEVSEDFMIGNTAAYWEENRHEPLTETEKSVYQMIDTLKNIPVVKTYTEIIKIAINGYKKFGKLDVGPYLSLYANNTVEGHRFQIGTKTNIDFSNKWVLGGRVAYGTLDDKFKYQGFVKYIADRERWTSATAEYTRDIDQVGLAREDLLGNSIFLAATRFGTLVRPYEFEQVKVETQRELFKGYTQKVSFRHRDFNPLYEFGYYTQPEAMSDSPVRNTFDQAEITVETRYAKDELYVQNDNERISLGTLKWPIFTLRYTHGIKGLFGSDFSYNKLSFNVEKYLKMGFLGVSDISLTAEKTFETLPYPLLKAHIGNESMFYTTAAYNLMNYGEFVSDQYVELRYLHHFEGFILNRIPLMRKLKWRLIANADVLYGSLSGSNRAVVADVNDLGEPVELGVLGATPYVELGYGIENIFKIFMVQAFHRLTYLDRAEVNKFGIKVSFQFVL